MDCGATCLRMIAKHYGRSLSLPKLRRLTETTREGTSLRRLSDAAEKLGFRTLGVKINFEVLAEEVPLPCIVHTHQNHFVVVYRVRKNRVYVADPGHGLLRYSREEFLEAWIGPDATPTTLEGIALIVEPTPRLQEVEADDVAPRQGFGMLFAYVFRYKRFLFQLLIGLLAGSLLQLIFPFLTQSVVDVGILNQNMHFVYLVLLAQLFLFLGRTGIEIIRGWILLHLSTRINISLISDFFIKLMNLPIAFFDVKMTGDILQRIGDHKRIENLLTGTTLNVLFSLVNLLVFGLVLIWYDPAIFFIFIGGSTLYFTWVTLFLKKRREWDYKRFAQMSDEQSKVIELINGMQEIKLHNAEKQKRWSWEYLQARLFRIELKSLALEQTQSVGSSFLNELKNILIGIYAAKLVIDGDITLGMMMSITYIIGQLNGPIQQLIGLVYTVQDAKIALERLAEIHNRPDEEPVHEEKLHEVPAGAGLHLREVRFHYTGSERDVIDGLTLDIPANQTTAIVGASGSGKTTLMKMLLKFYDPDAGEIRLGNKPLSLISQQAWRAASGVVMQEGYIFNDTIAHNICLGDDQIDRARLLQAVEIANIRPFIESLPLGYNTRIGIEGVGMSTGQKQRLLIARAVYKNPRFLFFDEATSALDAQNERIIMENLQQFFRQRTVVVIAHRLSTVKHADQIVVLEAGRICERGTHDSLIAERGRYYELVKNQLELERLHA